MPVQCGRLPDAVRRRHRPDAERLEERIVSRIAGLGLLLAIPAPHRDWLYAPIFARWPRRACGRG
ncbi:MAG: hypothetical protein H5U18_06920 [Rhodobacteraceae bacterium]|nr:hypothetical protein [Paracoccaceae bacterium]